MHAYSVQFSESFIGDTTDISPGVREAVAFYCLMISMLHLTTQLLALMNSRISAGQYENIKAVTCGLDKTPQSSSRLVANVKII